MVRKILFFTLSNFGDVILSLPVLDVLRTQYPKAMITVMVGPRAQEIFKDNPYVHNLIIYDKYARLREKIKLFFKLRKQGFDVVIDLRNTLYGALLPGRLKTSPFLYMPKDIHHMKERNLYRLRRALRHKGEFRITKDKVIYISQQDEDYINTLLDRKGIDPGDRIIVVSPAAGGKTRRWDKEKFVEVCQELSKDYPVVLIGRSEDKELAEYIKSRCKDMVYDFTGLTNLAQLATLLKRVCLILVCDTGTLQLASYLDVPIVALFGPSNEKKYGPWSSRYKVITSKTSCRPCTKPDCQFNTIKCMQTIKPDEVLDLIDVLLET
jgi:heptosyltransferase-2